MTYNTEGIILRFRDIGEYDRIYAILTREYGKVEAWAQGVRKAKSKLCAHLQPFYWGDFMLARGRRFERIAQVRVLQRLAGLESDLTKMGEVFYAAELTDLALRPGDKARAVFELWQSFLTQLQTEVGVSQHCAFLSRSFVFKLLQESGFAPELHTCLFCKKIIAEGVEQQFSATRGGVLCLEHNLNLEEWGNCLRISGSTLAALAQILTGVLRPFAETDSVFQELKILELAMIRAHFDQEPRSRVFLEWTSQNKEENEFASAE